MEECGREREGRWVEGGRVGGRGKNGSEKGEGERKGSKERRGRMVKIRKK